MPFWTSNKKTVKATFGAGCYWKVELYFQRTFGVYETRVGFAKGKTADPQFQNKVEVVEVFYNPREVSYDTLLTVFWEIHDATVQQPVEYRSAILGHTEEQVIAAMASKVKYQKRNKHLVQTEISPFHSFSPSLFYHQHYFQKRGHSIKKQYAISSQ